MNDSPQFEDKQPLLDEEDELSTQASEMGLGDVSIWRKRVSRTSGLVWFARLTIAVILTASLAVNVWVFLNWKPSTMIQDNADTRFPYSPVDGMVDYEVKDIDMDDHNDIYGGPPTDESDRAWAALVAPTAIKVTAEEMKKLNKQSIRIHDDNEEIYMGALDVYHQLHCVKRMVQSRWPERYPDVAAIGAFTDAHFNHCIQVLRKGVMCSADRSVDTWTYNATGYPILHSAQRKCTNWDQLHQWATSRAAGPFIEVDVYTQDQDGWYGPQLAQ